MKSTDLIINVNPKSIFSESIKTIRTNLAFSAIGNEMKVLLATSPAAGDGKSFISANLAVAYAQEGKKVLMIDCDLRRGRQHEIFEVMNLTSGGYPNVDLLPTGPTPPNPIELLASENNQKLLNELRKLYDIIILDCPPVIGLSDTMIMTKFSDANIIVVSNKKTKIESLDRAKKIFAQANAKITGVVINKASVKGSSYYSYYSDEYYRDTDSKKKRKR